MQEFMKWKYISINKYLHGIYPTDNHVVGIVSGSEDYEIMKVSCKELFGEINELVEKGEIEVKGNKIPLEFTHLVITREQ